MSDGTSRPTRSRRDDRLDKWPRSRPRCANCMAHCGYEPTAALATHPRAPIDPRARQLAPVAPSRRSKPPHRRTTDRRRGSSSSSRWLISSRRGVQRPAQLGAAHRRKTPDASVSRLRSAQKLSNEARTAPASLVRTSATSVESRTVRVMAPLRRAPEADRVAARDDEHRAALVLCSAHQISPGEARSHGSSATSPSRALRPTRHRPRLRHALVAATIARPMGAPLALDHR